MAYMSQEKKKQIAENMKKVLAGTGIKYSLSVRDHSAIVMKITKGPVDFIKNHMEVNKNGSGCPAYVNVNPYDKTQPVYIDINPYHYKSQFSGPVLDIVEKIMTVLNDGNHDNSNSQIDYFDVGWYVYVKVGTWTKPYVLTGA